MVEEELEVSRPTPWMLPQQKSTSEQRVRTLEMTKMGCRRVEEIATARVSRFVITLLAFSVA